MTAKRRRRRRRRSRSRSRRQGDRNFYVEDDFIESKNPSAIYAMSGALSRAFVANAVPLGADGFPETWRELYSR